MKEVHKKPIQLISFDQNKQVNVNKDAVNWLLKANQEKHIAVVTVVGKYRTGKSYILNRVLLNQNSGFQVGPTVNACTKGLWVWPELIPHPHDPTLQYMVMDTEGLGSLQQGEQTDTRIFLMAMLLSSYFIYNSQGKIDQQAVQSLSMVISLSKMLQKGGQKEASAIMNCFPSFLWLVRDFALRLEDVDGRTISPQEYLENALKQQNGTSDLVKRKNNIRKQLVNFFKNRDCFTLIRPVDDEAKLRNMSALSDSELRPKFLQLVSQLRSKVLLGLRKKMFRGKPCSPSMFIELCQHFCQSINEGGLPEIENNWDLVCRAEANRIQKRCLDDFRKMLKKYQEKDYTRVNLKEFQSCSNQFVAGILKYFQKNALGSKAERKKVMKDTMLEEYQKVKKKICMGKNSALDAEMDSLNSEVDSMINGSSVESIFDITEKYDSIIEQQSKGASEQTLLHLYEKCYQGFKTNAFTLFGNILQGQAQEKSLLQDKLGYYQNSLDKLQEQHSKKVTQADKQERQLSQKVAELQAKSRQAEAQLLRARQELSVAQQSRRGWMLGQQN